MLTCAAISSSLVLANADSQSCSATAKIDQVVQESRPGNRHCIVSGIKFICVVRETETLDASHTYRQKSREAAGGEAPITSGHPSTGTYSDKLTSGK